MTFVNFRARRPTVAGLAAILVGGGLTVLHTASAAEAIGVGPPAFVCSTSQVFVAQGNGGSQLLAGTQGPGNITFNPVGGTSAITYNAIGYNSAQNLIYGIRTDSTNTPPGIPGDVVRVDATGTAIDIGATVPAALPTPTPLFNAGTFDQAGTYYVLSASAATDGLLHKIDVTAGLTHSTTTLSSGELPADITFIAGLLWGERDGATTGELSRIDPVTGTVTQFSVPFIPNSAGVGAAWTYGNGNLGLQDNVTGAIYQVKIANPTSATPTFTLISTIAGPIPTGQNDGTSCVAQPVDLSLTKTTTPASPLPGALITWTLTVHNNGPNNSSGFVINDPVPAGVTNPASTTAGCTVAAQALTCTEGPLAAGSDFVAVLTGNAPADGSAVTNTATVTGNEADPTPGNNTATSSTVPPGADLSLTKTSDPDHVAPGGVVTWTLTVRNHGPGPSTGYTVTDVVPAAVTNLATTTPGCAIAGQNLTCGEGPLPVGEIFTITFTGVAPQSGRIDNTAVVVGDDPDPQAGNNTATFRTHVEEPGPPAETRAGGGANPPADCDRRGVAAIGGLLPFDQSDRCDRRPRPLRTG